MSSEPEFGGIIKLYQGLYISQQFGTRDIESISMNHISHIVNCTADHVSNFCRTENVKYLSYKLNEADPDVVLFDPADKTIFEVYNFIEEARQQGESVMIHGFKEYRLPIALFTAYLMLKFRWTLPKSMQFIERRVGPLPIKGGLLNQLRSLEIRCKTRTKQAFSTQWEITPSMSLQEQTFHNTYINALGLGKSKHVSYQSRKVARKKVTWGEAAVRPQSYKVKKLKSILKTGGFPIQINEKDKSERISASQSKLSQKQKQAKPNSSLDTKSFKLIKDKIQDKLRTTIQLFNNPKEEPQNSRLKSEPEQQKRPLINLSNIQKPPKQSQSSEVIPAKRSLQVKERVNTEENAENVEASSSDITRQIIKKIIFEKNNNFMFKDTSMKNKENSERERSKNTSEIGMGPTKQPKPVKENKFKTIINNFMSDGRLCSKPESPAQKPDKFEKQEVGNSGSNGSKGKIDIKLKTQFRGFSPMLKDTGSKRREMDVIMSTKMFSDGARKAWK